MAKLYFYYSAMNAGKSTVLLQSSYNYLSVCRKHFKAGMSERRDDELPLIDEPDR